jgi:hypothetical protein
MTRRRLFDAAVVAVAVLAGIVGVFDVAVPLRSVLVSAFVLFGPGAAVVRLAGLRAPAPALALAAAVSVALATLVASATLYAGLWSPRVTLVLLVAVTLALMRVRRRVEPGSPPTRRAA